MKRFRLISVTFAAIAVSLSATANNCTENQIVASNGPCCTYLHTGTAWNPAIPDTCTFNLLKASFDSGLEGWTKHTPSDPNTNVTWYASGGNPGGYIRLNDAAQGVADWFAAPAAFKGNKSAYYNGKLQFDLRSNYNHTGSQIGVRLIGNGITIQVDLQRPNQTWRTYSIPISAGSWLVLESGLAATQEEILMVLENIITLNISGDWRVGVEQTSLDNVMMLGGSAFYELSGATHGSGTTLDGVSFNPGTTTVTWTITDACLNVSQCIYTITVEGEELCYESETNLIFSGMVDSCQSVQLFAAEKISLVPGVMVACGGRLHARIDNTGNHCSLPMHDLSEASIKTEKQNQQLNPEPVSFFRVFPNPTNGRFILELNETETNNVAVAEIYSTRGEKLLFQELASGDQHDMDLSFCKPGVYLIRVLRGSETGSLRIIRK